LGSYTKKILISRHCRLRSKEGCRYVGIADYLLTAKGHYRNNKKIGTRVYSSDNDHLISVDKQISNYGNGNKKVENRIE
jgi:hypothetical protein